MVKRRSRHGKGTAALFIGLLAFHLCCFPVFAQDTEIVTVVPKTHSIAVLVESGGAVIDADGVVHTTSYTAAVPHNGTLALILRPESGYALEEAQFNGQTQKVSAGRLKIERILQDGALAIGWKNAPASPDDAVYTVVGRVTENGTPAAGTVLELRSRLKTFMTDTDGKFRFDKVEAGSHSLTALRDGKVVGYLPFTLEPGSTGLSIEKQVDGSALIRTGASALTLDMAISLQDDGTMEITKVTSITDKETEEHDPPPTGDDSLMRPFWAALLALGGIGLLRGEKKLWLKS